MVTGIDNNKDSTTTSLAGESRERPSQQQQQDNDCLHQKRTVCDNNQQNFVSSTDGKVNSDKNMNTAPISDVKNDDDIVVDRAPNGIPSSDEIDDTLPWNDKKCDNSTATDCENNSNKNRDPKLYSNLWALYNIFQSSSWIRRLLESIQKIKTDDKEKQGSPPSRKKKKFYYYLSSSLLAATASLIVIRFVSSYQRQRKRNQITTSSQNNATKTTTRQSSSSSSLFRSQGNRKATSSYDDTTDSYHAAVTVPISRLLLAANRGFVEKALFGSNGIIYFRPRSNDNSNDADISSSRRWNRTVLPKENATTLQKEILQLLSIGTSGRKPVDVEVLPESMVNRFVPLLLSALPFVYLAFLYRLIRSTTQGDGDSLFGLSKIFTKKSISSSITDNSTTATSFNDVAGLDETIVEVREVVEYLKNPIQYLRMGARVPGGVLLYGPPGSGKTLLARAVANEASVDCFLQCSASDFVEVYVGRGAARIRSLFRAAREQAIQAAKQRRRRQHYYYYHILQSLSHYAPTMLKSFLTLSSYDDDAVIDRPCSAIIFIDELDALAKTRSSGSGGGSNDEREQTLNQLLTEMDGFMDKTGNNADNHHRNLQDTTAVDNYDSVTIVVMAASNRADTLDPAIIRRFDRQIHVGYPDSIGRKAILQVHARRIPLPTGNGNDDDGIMQWDTLASDEVSGNFSGADLRNLINEAALLAVRESSSVVQQSHLNHAARRIRLMKEGISQSSTSSLPLQFPFTMR